MVAALAAGPSDLLALVPRVYDDVAPAMWPLAGRSLLAHLRKLEIEGRARALDADGLGWAPG